MKSLAPYLLASSAAVILAMGLLHLVYTFSGPKLRPRDADLESRMEEVPPVISDQTTMWKAWVGFNASHSFGAILFGLMYGYLAIERSSVVFQSAFLRAVGLVLLCGYALLAKRYWFSIPLRGILLALLLYILALAVA